MNRSSPWISPLLKWCVLFRPCICQVPLFALFLHRNHMLSTLHRVREKLSYPLVLWTSTILNLVVRNPGFLVQKVLLKTQKQSGIYFTAYYHIISLFAGKLTGLVTKARFLSQMELVKKQMIEMAVEWRSFKGIFNLILKRMRFAFMTIR